MFKFVVKAFPESVEMVTVGPIHQGLTILHKMCLSGNTFTDIDCKAKMHYLYNLCPALVHLRCSKGETPLHSNCAPKENFSLEIVKALCNIDESHTGQR